MEWVLAVLAVWLLYGLWAALRIVGNDAPKKVRQR
jgi:hypothetical protein